MSSELLSLDSYEALPELARMRAEALQHVRPVNKFWEKVGVKS